MPHATRIHLALTLTMVFWGASFVATRITLAYLTPLTYMAVRFSMSFAIFALIFARRGLPRFDRSTHLLIFLTSFAEPVLYFLFESWGVYLTGASNASVIIATVPIVVSLMAALFLGEPISPRVTIGAIGSLVGIVLMVLGAPTSQFRLNIIGNLLIVGAVFSAATYITMARSLTQNHSPIEITGLQITYGAICFTVLWFFQPAPARIPTVNFDVVLALAFLVGGATIGAFLLYNWSLRHVSAGRASLYINAIPVVTIITSRVVLNERLVPIQICGVALVLVSVWSANRNPRIHQI